MSAVLTANTTTVKDPASPAKYRKTTTHTPDGGIRVAPGKYREIIVAVALFLLFDLGVLVLNFYTSFQIAEDAVGINLSGRQRMLSQRTAKALLAVETAQLKGLAPGQPDRKSVV